MLKNVIFKEKEIQAISPLHKGKVLHCIQVFQAAFYYSGFIIGCIYFMFNAEYIYSLIALIISTASVLKFHPPLFLAKWCMQKVQIQIRLLLKELSDLGLHCLPFHRIFCETNALKIKFLQKKCGVKR